MNCNDCQELISDYVDGELEPGAMTKIENHLANCEPCRAVRDDLLQIVHFSRQLPLHTPSAAVWSRIQVQLEEEQPKTFVSRLQAWWTRTQSLAFHFSIPQVATLAAVFVIMAVVGAISFQKYQTGNLPPNNLQMQSVTGPTDELGHKDDFQWLESRINELNGTIEQRKSSWSPDLKSSFEANMIYVDQSLLQCRQEYKNNPSDEICRDLLRNAYAEKLRLLDGYRNF